MDIAAAAARGAAQDDFPDLGQRDLVMQKRPIELLREHSSQENRPRYRREPHLGILEVALQRGSYFQIRWPEFPMPPESQCQRTRFALELRGRAFLGLERDQPAIMIAG